MGFARSLNLNNSAGEEGVYGIDQSSRVETPFHDEMPYDISEWMKMFKRRAVTPSSVEG
ncbi:hypothetical protein FHW89_004032 [Mucilaginibacter sp. SG564]|nr:hypothetical protein [Mucilaginibacter sp. SG564]